MLRTLPLLCAGILLPIIGVAQCPSGQSEVYIEVITDEYGYETYWELLPAGSNCGVGTIFSGGNTTVGCDGAGDQQQIEQGYPNDAEIMEGPWCLTDNAQYDIYWGDDWGDGGGTFNVIINGMVVEQFTGVGTSDVFTFTVAPPAAYDMTVERSRVPLFSRVGDVNVVHGDVKNLGGTTITSFDLNYSVDGAAPVVMNVTGVSIAPFEMYSFQHDVTWQPSIEGDHVVTVWASNLNGENDMVPDNDVATTDAHVSEAIPMLVDHYLFGTPTVEMIADDDNDVLVPRDLSFHPDPARNELWVINKDVENTGGSTVRLFDPNGGANMTWLWQRDPNAWHFMSIPSGIAFGDNGNFATSPGVFDANHNGAPPFTGPTLWSSDPAIYAQPGFGPLGSHLDMVHANPNSQGIAHDIWNRYWVVDGYNSDIVMNDFRMDHGPGQDYHLDAIIRRYADFSITKDPNDHIVSHAVLHKPSGWLYVVDHGGQRVLRLNINTGTVSGPGAFQVFEPYAEYSTVTGYDWDVVVSTGLAQPAGIDVLGDRLLVSDHATGEIIIYDIADPAFPELGRVATGSPGIMGIEIGPDGHIWYVNATLHQVGKVVPDVSASIGENVVASSFDIFPSPANDMIYLPISSGIRADQQLEVVDVLGRTLITVRAAEMHRGFDVTDLTNGTYTVRVVENGSIKAARFVVQR
jgi:hypothetical protein